MPLATAEERFWSKVNKTDGCWFWTGVLFDSGYGVFWLNGKTTRAHRYSFAQHHGPVPPGLVLDHKCRVRSCVNPLHLEAVTVGENIRRGETGQEQTRRTHCAQGHPFDEANTRVRNGKRYCRACQREAARRKASLSRSREPVAEEVPISGGSRCRSASKATQEWLGALVPDGPWREP